MFKQMEYTTKSKRKGEGVLLLLFLLYLIWDATPYFTWSTYRNGILSDLGGVDFVSVFFLLIVAVFFILYLKNGVIKCSYFQLKSAFSFIIIAILLLVICGSQMSNLVSGKWVPFFLVTIFLISPESVKIKLYKIYITFFAITLILPIIYFVLNTIGITIPHNTLQSFENIKQNYTYDWYPGAVVLKHIYNGILYRLCGIYNEPGQVGTMAALFLTMEGYKLKGKWRNIIIFIGGILSFSLAFFVLTIVYFVLHNIWEKKHKNVLAILVILASYFVFISIPIKNPNIANIQSRMILTSAGLSGDNRTNDKYDEIFKTYMSNDSISVTLFGYGDGAMVKILLDDVVDGSSYKKIFYDYGIFGMLAIVGWIFYYCISKSKIKGNKYVVLMALMYIINFYQRPVIFKPAYFLILLSGIEVFEVKKYGFLDSDGEKKNESE